MKIVCDTSSNVELLTLDQSLDLDIAGANRLYSAHLNKYALQVFDILGMKDMDIEAAEGVEIRLADGRSLMDFSAGLGVAALGQIILGSSKRNETATTGR